MTDKEKLKALLGEWGVPYAEEDGMFETVGGQKAAGTSVAVGGWKSNVESPKVGGYIGFYTMFLFDTDGSFRLMGAWE